MEFLEKTWKFLLGIFVTVIGGMLLFKKDNASEIIDESTKAGNNSFDKIKKSNQVRNEKDNEADLKNREEIAKINKVYKENLDNLNLRMRKKVERSLNDGDAKKATEQLASFLGANNLDGS